MWREIIVLANSRKEGNRCIAGIDVETGKWIRPVYEDGRQGIPLNIINIDGKEPQLLDIISIPVDKNGPHRYIQPENHQLLDGRWERVRRANIKQIKRFIKQDGLIFYNTYNRISLNELRSRKDKHSLCLIRANVNFFTESDIHKRKRVNAQFQFSGNEYIIPVTDYEFWLKFPAYHEGFAECLLTISLGLPYKGYCYKFVAGVILLNELTLRKQNHFDMEL